MSSNVNTLFELFCNVSMDYYQEHKKYPHPDELAYILDLPMDIVYKKCWEFYLNHPEIILINYEFFPDSDCDLDEYVYLDVERKINPRLGFSNEGKICELNYSDAYNLNEILIVPAQIREWEYDDEVRVVLPINEQNAWPFPRKVLIESGFDKKIFLCGQPDSSNELCITFPKNYPFISKACIGLINVILEHHVDTKIERELLNESLGYKEKIYIDYPGDPNKWLPLNSLIGICGFSSSLCQLLEKNDYIALEFLIYKTEKELLEIEGIGRKKLQIIIDLLDYFGLALRDEGTIMMGPGTDRYIHLSSKSLKTGDSNIFKTSIEDAGFSTHFIKKLKEFGIETVGEIDEQCFKNLNLSRREIGEYITFFKLFNEK